MFNHTPYLINIYVSQADNLLLVDKLIVFCVYLEDNRDNGKQQRQQKIAVDEFKPFSVEKLTRRTS